jgi:hypothetical protein
MLCWAPLFTALVALAHWLRVYVDQTVTPVYSQQAAARREGGRARAAKKKARGKQERYVGVSVSWPSYTSAGAAMSGLLHTIWLN